VGARFLAVSTVVLHLAQDALKEITMLKMVLVMGLLLGVTALAAPGSKSLAADSKQDGALPVVAKPEQPKAKDVERGGDHYGDPLPPGVLARLGTVRFRHEGLAFGLIFSGDAKMLVGNTTSGIIVWDATTGKELHRLPVRISLRIGAGLDVSPNGTTLATVELRGSEATEISLWDLQSGKKTRTLSLPPPKDAELADRGGPMVRFAPNGKSLAITRGGAGTFHLLDLETGKVRASFGDIRTGIASLAYSPDGKTLAIGTDNPGLQLWDIATGNMIHGMVDMAFATAFSPDGKMVAAGKRDWIKLFDPASGAELGSLEAKMDGVMGLSFTPDSKTLVSCGQDGKVRIWDIDAKKNRFILDSRMSGGRSMALSRDGKTVAIGTDGSAVRLWSVLTGKELFPQYEGHDSWFNCLAFSPDGKTLVSGEFNHQICVWDTASWKLNRVFKGPALSLSFSPDSKRLASVPGNNTVHIWEMDTGKDVVIKVPDTD
jgi:WD40 repeat protein